jgi:hypothetical protein
MNGKLGESIRICWSREYTIWLEALQGTLHTGARTAAALRELSADAL